MKPKYLYKSFGYRIGLPKGERFRGGGLKTSCGLEK